MRPLGLLLALAVLASPGLVPAAASASTRDPAPITVLSYNVRANTSGSRLPAAYRFAARRTKLAALINSHDPGIFGLQEASKARKAGRAAQWFTRAFDREYNVYEPRKGMTPKLIFFRSSRFRIAKRPGGSLQAGQFHLPSTARCAQPRRTMSWVVLREKGVQRRIFVGNTHLPIGGECWSSRVKAASLIHRMIALHNPDNHPVVLMGDFNNRAEPCIRRNAERQALPISRLAERSTQQHQHNLDASVRLTNCDQTLHGNWPAARPKSTRRIDFILHSRRLEAYGQDVDARRTVKRPQGGRTSPSDHYAVVTRLRPQG